MNDLCSFIAGRFRTKREIPPSRITAPESHPRDGFKLLNDQRDAYFRQSAATTRGRVAPFDCARSFP